MIDSQKARPSTRAVHAGMDVEPTTGAVIPPIFQTSTYVQSSPGVHKGYDYSRADNPTRDHLERALAELEGGRCGLAFSSGLAAEQAVIQLLKPGQRVLVSDDVYGGTGRLFRTLFAKYGIEFEFIDMTDQKAFLEEAQKGFHLLWVETPTNPLLKVIDLAFAAELAKKHNALFVVDNTFASPIFQSPLQWGADIVVHSTTKYIGGHSDLIGGALITAEEELGQQLKYVQFAAGAVPSPFESFLLLRSIKTLALRMHAHNANATALVEALQGHAKIKRTLFPGHPEHPQHAIAAKQMSGYSGMVSLELNTDFSGTVKFLQGLRVFQLAESLGGVESLVNHPEQMTHASVPEPLRIKLGIGPNLVRLSCGIEDGRDLVEDVLQALEQVTS